MITACRQTHEQSLFGWSEGWQLFYIHHISRVNSHNDSTMMPVSSQGLQWIIHKCIVLLHNRYGYLNTVVQVYGTLLSMCCCVVELLCILLAAYKFV